jgi:hypothetical protein
VEALEQRWCPSDFYWKPFSGIDWGFLRPGTLESNWVDASGTRLTYLPLRTDRAFFDGNVSNSDAATVTVNPEIAALITQNGYSGTINIYPGSTIHVTDAYVIADSSLQDGHANFAFGDTASFLTFDGTLGMGSVYMSGAEGRVTFGRVTSFKTSSSSISYADWRVGPGGNLHLQETGITQFMHPTKNAPFWTSPGGTITVDEGNNSTVGPLFDTVNGPATGTALNNDGVIDDGSDTNAMTNGDTILVGGGAGHMSLYNNGTVKIARGNILESTGYNAYTAGYSYYQSNGVTRLGYDQYSTSVHWKGRLVATEGVDSEGGTLEADGQGLIDTIETNAGNAFNNTTITTNAAVGPSTAGYVSIQFQTSYATVFTNCTFSMHLDASTAGHCDLIASTGGNITFSGANNSLTITEDNGTVTKGTGWQWLVLQTAGVNTKVTGTLIFSLVGNLVLDPADGNSPKWFLDAAPT